MMGAIDLGIADHGERGSREQVAQLAITLLADTAKLVLAPARVLLRHEPQLGREVPIRSESLGIQCWRPRLLPTRPTPGFVSSRLLVALDRCQKNSGHPLVCLGMVLLRGIHSKTSRLREATKRVGVRPRASRAMRHIRQRRCLNAFVHCHRKNDFARD